MFSFTSFFMRYVMTALFAAACLTAVGCKRHASRTNSGEAVNSPLRGDASSDGFDVLDVSYLFPLPTLHDTFGATVEHQAMLKVHDSQDDFSLLSPGLFEQIFAKAAQGPQSEAADAKRIHDRLHGAKNIAKWHVTSIRFEPCFKAPKAAETACVPMLSAIVQPIVPVEDVSTIQDLNPRNPRLLVRPPIGRSGLLTTEDEAIHLIFKLDKAGFDDVMATISAIKTDLEEIGAQTRGQALRIHPGLERDTESKLQARGRTLPRERLKEVLRRRCDPALNLQNVEIMVTAGLRPLSPQGPVWTFSSFRMHHGELQHHPVGRGVMPIPGGPSSQAYYQSFRMRDGYFPALKHPYSPHSFADIAARWRAAKPFFGNASLLRTDQARAAILETALQVDDPRLHNIKSADCVTCHYSTTLRLLSRAAPPPLSISSLMRPFAFNIARRDLSGAYFARLGLAFTGVSGKPADEFEPYPYAEYNMHQFSYFFRYPSIGQRVMNDSAVAADYLNRMRGAAPSAPPVPGQ